MDNKYAFRQLSIKRIVWVAGFGLCKLLCVEKPVKQNLTSDQLTWIGVGFLPWLWWTWLQPSSSGSSWPLFALTWRWPWSWRRTFGSSASSAGPAAWPGSYMPPGYRSLPFSWSLLPVEGNIRMWAVSISLTAGEFADEFTQKVQWIEKLNI